MEYCLSLMESDLNTEIKTPLPSSKPFTIGRGGDISPVVLGNLISRLHVRVLPDDQGWEVVDQDSLNGLYDEAGHRLQVVRVAKPGDQAWLATPPNRIGGVRIIVEAGRVCQLQRETVRFDLEQWRKTEEAVLNLSRTTNKMAQDLGVKAHRSCPQISLRDALRNLKKTLRAASKSTRQRSG
jgi:hypothetical protein